MLSKQIIPSVNLTIPPTPVTAFSAAASFTTDPQYIAYVTNYSFQVLWVAAGAGTGTFTLQCCNDKERNTGVADSTNLLHWVTVGSSSQLTSAGEVISPSTMPSLVWNISNAGYRWVRLAYTVSGGTLVVSANLQIKSPQ